MLRSLLRREELIDGADVVSSNELVKYTRQGVNALDERNDNLVRDVLVYHTVQRTLCSGVSTGSGYGDVPE